MKFKRGIIFTALMITCYTLIGCTNQDETKSLKGELKIKEEQIDSLNTIVKTNDETIANLKTQIADLEVKTNAKSNSALNQAFVVVNLLKNKDMAGLSKYIHPEKGVRFTPYAYIETQTNLVFKADEIAKIMEDTQLYKWGEYDGSGEPIDLSFKDYYSKFIYDVDFAEPDRIGNNKIITTGNTVNNISQAYPKGSFVEFNFEGFDAQYAGMDWKSLRLVFEDVNGTWYLVGIIHDQWTI